METMLFKSFSIIFGLFKSYYVVWKLFETLSKQTAKKKV